MPDRTHNMQNVHTQARPTTGAHAVEAVAAARPTAPRPAGRTRVAQSGSLLILCVTVLVIIALVGIAFLQRVRLDQAATARHERQYMDLVINGILADIGKQMTDDIFMNTEFGDELYDYPWTDESVQRIDAFTINGSTVKVNGTGKLDTATGDWIPTHEDDRWLASTAPVLSPVNTYNWLHLTNLTGIWLDLEANNPEEPIDQRTSVAWRNSDMDIRTTYLADVTGRDEPLGVDADGDGIFDSRWQWVPVNVRDFGGRKFIMAARIIDLNSMLNVNTATSLTSTGGQNDPEISGGYSPAWADLSRLLSRNKLSSPAAWRTELANVLNFRIGKLSLAPFPEDMTYTSSVKEMQTIWEEQASIFGNLDRNYVADSEVELRRFGGINDISIESPLEAKMPRLLRQNPAPTQPEASYRDVVGTALLPSEAISAWFYGDNNGTATNDGDAVPVRNRKFPALRHWLTTASGVGAYVTNYGGAASGGGRLKFEVNNQYTNKTELIERIKQAFKLPDPLTPSSNWYLRIADDATMNRLVDEYATAIIDYSDPDNIPTQGFYGAYGLERLPFLREAYFHMLYEFTGDTLDATNNPGPADGTPDTWEPVDDTQAVVIELGNPFAHRMNGVNQFDTKTGQVEDNGLEGRIRIVIEQGGVEVSSWIFDSSVPDIEAHDPATSSDTLIVISDPLDTTQNDQGLGDDPEVQLSLTGSDPLTKTNDGELSFNPGTSITVRLEVDVDPDPGVENWVTYDRMDTDARFDSDYPIANIPTGTPFKQHAQRSFRRNSVDINYISSDTGESSNIGTDPQDPSSSTGIFNTSIHEFRKDNKSSVGAGTWTMPVGFQLAVADQPMRSVAELAWVHMFGFTTTVPFSERVGDPAFNTPNRHFLLIDAADPDYTVLPSAGIPHAAVLMDLFTTVGTNEDRRDNDNNDGDSIINQETSPDPSADGRSIDNTTEQIIPGTINVNTAPLHILTLGTPLAGSIDDTEDLMRLIIAYRDRPLLTWANYPPDDPATPGYNDGTLRQNIRTQYGVDRLTKPGIASIGELMYMGLNNDQPYTMQRYGIDGNPALPVAVDLYPDTEETGATIVHQGDDNEQRLARFQMLSQTLTTRSDRFAAYVVVRGYDWDPLSGDPIASDDPKETARFIAIFDRGSMENANDSPRVIGFVRLQ